MGNCKGSVASFTDPMNFTSDSYKDNNYIVIFIDFSIHWHVRLFNIYCNLSKSLKLVKSSSLFYFNSCATYLAYKNTFKHNDKMQNTDNYNNEWIIWNACSVPLLHIILLQHDHHLLRTSHHITSRRLNACQYAVQFVSRRKEGGRSSFFCTICPSLSLPLFYSK